MQKWTIPMLALMSVSALSGCGDKGADIPESDILEDLRNFKLDNARDYKAVGYGAMDENEPQRRAKQDLVDVRRKEKDETGFGIACTAGGTYERDFYRSNKPFYLIGQLNDGTVEKLNFKNDEKSVNIQISKYLKTGNFVFFFPFDGVHGYGEEENGERTYFCAPWAGSRQNDFILSLQTGKIYDLQSTGIDDFEIDEIEEETNGDGTIIAHARIAGNYGYILIGENENGLTIRTANYLPGSIDKYGNKLTEYGIIEAGDKNLHPISSYFEKSQQVAYDFRTGVFFARDKYSRGDSYVFGENGQFIKVNGAGEYDDYIYNQQGGIINVNDVNSFDSDMLGGWRSVEKGYGDDEGYDFTNVSKEELLEYLMDSMPDHYYWAIADNGDVVYSQYAVKYGSDGYEICSKPSRVYTTAGIYNQISEYAYLRDTSLVNDNDWRSLIFRGEGAYQLKEGSIYKYAFVDDSVSKLDLDGCIITSLRVDEEKHIIIEGVDKDYKKFNGYLDLNDKISLTKYSNSVDVILTPIN